MLECQVGVQSDTRSKSTGNPTPLRLSQQSTAANKPNPGGMQLSAAKSKATVKQIAALLEENDIPYLSLRNVRDAF